METHLHIPEEVEAIVASWQHDHNPEFPWLEKEIFVRYQVKGSRKRLGELSVRYTAHAYARAKGRGITANQIITVLDYGTVVSKQGLLFHFLKDDDLPATMASRLREAVTDVVVVTDHCCQNIITCYKSRQAPRRIRKKSKFRYGSSVTQFDQNNY